MSSCDYNVLRSMVVELHNFIQHRNCQVVQLFQITPLLINAFTTIIPKYHLPLH